MNERIKELMIKAIYDVDRIYDPIDNPLNEEVSKMYIPDCFAEKFAELIVQECVSVCENEGYRLSMDTKTEHHRDLAKQCHKICSMMEKHFGVKNA